MLKVSLPTVVIIFLAFVILGCSSGKYAIQNQLMTYRCQNSEQFRADHHPDGKRVWIYFRAEERELTRVPNSNDFSDQEVTLVALGGEHFKVIKNGETIFDGCSGQPTFGDD